MVGGIVLSVMVLASGFVIWEVWVCGFYLHVGNLVGVVVVEGRIWFVVVDVTRLCDCGDLRREGGSVFQVVFEFLGVPGVIGGRCSVFFDFFLLPVGARHGVESGCCAVLVVWS